jgi:hypothetical protein
MPPKLFPISFGKVPANPNRRSNWKMLANPNRYTDIQIPESQSKSEITIQILESHSNSSFTELNYDYSPHNKNHKPIHAL